MDVLEKIVYPFTLDAFKNGRQRIVEGFNVGETCMRVMEISLKAGTKTFELPLDNVSAVMYVKRPSDTNPSINECTVDSENNRIVYEIQESDITEAGLVEMQLKLFDNENIIISPSFAFDVWGSIVSDSQASQSAAYTALTAALAEAQAYSQAAIVSVTIDQDTLIFTATAANGTTYSSNALAVAVAAVEAYKLASEGYSVGTQDGEPVEEDSPYFQNNAKYLAEAAAGSASDASDYKDAAFGYKGEAATSAGNAATSEGNASAYAIRAQSYAVGGTSSREGEDSDCAKYFKEQCEQIAASMEGGFLPMGTILFANLPVSGMVSGWMYNISDDFTSDNRFKDGGGKAYAAGTNVYYTADGYWDCMSGAYQKVNNKTGGNITLDGSDLALTGYTKPAASSAIAATDSINTAMGKLEAKSDELSNENASLDGRLDTIEGATYVNSFGGRTGDITLQSSDVTGALGYTPPQQDTTYSDATQSTHGLMSTADKTKLDGLTNSDGIVPVSKGGTGASTLTSGAVLIGNGTGAIATRSITNNTATTTAITANTNIPTMNTLKNAINRATGITSADTNYTTYMMRGIAASTTDLTAGTSALTSGCIYLVYE